MGKGNGVVAVMMQAAKARRANKAIVGIRPPSIYPSSARRIIQEQATHLVKKKHRTTPPTFGRHLIAGEAGERRGCLQTPCSSSESSSAGGGSTMGTSVLKAEDINKDNFAPFGQVIAPQDDGKHFDSSDAQLVLDQGTPRFYMAVAAKDVKDPSGENMQAFRIPPGVFIK